MDYIMTTDKLTKVYGSKAAAKDVSIHIREGEIYGLIGRNGAGKTTVMRMLSGLSNPTSGSFTMFGKTGAEAKKLMHKVGVLIEHPGLYPTLSARENLKIKAIALGIKTPNRVVSELLELVGLENTEKENLRDEKKITIMISSHILDELGKLANAYGIIHEGELIDEFTTEELSRRCGKYVTIKTDNNDSAVKVLKKNGFSAVEIDDNRNIRVNERLNDTPLMSKIIVGADIGLKEIVSTDISLEDYYLSVTGGKHNG